MWTKYFQIKANKWFYFFRGEILIYDLTTNHTGISGEIKLTNGRRSSLDLKIMRWTSNIRWQDNLNPASRKFFIRH